jgi:hypothetical protein
MNDIASPPHSMTRRPALATFADPRVRPEPDHVAAARPTADAQGIRLTWRVLDRLAMAAALGVIFASPRSALLSVEMLRPTSPSTVHADADTHRRGVNQ